MPSLSLLHFCAWLLIVQYHIQLDFDGLGLLLPVSCIITYLVILVRNFESHMHFADQCVPVKISNSAEYCVVQALQFQGVIVCYVLSGGTGRSHY
jgi:hypothetical protein